MSKLITVDAWAEAIFGSAKPHPNTLRNWRLAGRIYPVPIQCGRKFFVEPNAIYMDDAGEMKRRLSNGSKAS